MKRVFGSLVLFSILIISVSMTWQKKTKIVFFGDSITRQGAAPGGYIVKMNEQLKAKGLDAQYDLVGAGIGGNKVYDLYLRMDSDVLAQKPDVVVIWIGVNDVWHKASSGTGTDADKFEKFYVALIKKLQANKIKVIVATPAVIGERSDYSNQQDGDLNYYSNVIRKLAKENQLDLVDLRKDFMDYILTHNPENKESGILTTDRVHLNGEGNNLVAQKMLEALVPGFK